MPKAVSLPTFPFLSAAPPILAWLLAAACVPSFAAAALPKSQLTFYGAWDDAKIPVFQRFDLITLQPGMYGTGDNEPAAIAKVKAKGTKVLLYVTLGEDDRTYDNAAPVAGDGKGPVHFNAATRSVVYGNKGIASFYLDEWNAKGYDSDPVNRVPDGLPDRQGDWGSCMVNAGDPAWQNEVMATVTSLMDEGADGLFLDTPETADPWHGYGWTAEGMYGLIKKIRDAYPGKLLILNRGLFFFEPNFPFQYAWSPRKLINGVVFESYYSDSDYPADLGGNGTTHLNPFFELNKYTSAPRLNAEFGRSDNPGSILHIDYAAAPALIQAKDPVFFGKVMQETAVEQGWLPQITDRLLVEAPTTALDFPPAADKAPPHWQNTAVGFGSLIDPAPAYYMAPGDDRSAAEFGGNAPKPRVGLLKAIPGNGSVTLRWDVAADQTRPVRYNVYYAKQALVDFTAPQRLPDVPTQMSADYTLRGYTDADDACPYEFTITGLENNRLYRFAVRAEDGTAGVAAPSAGRIGPAGGIEDANLEILAAVPRDSAVFPIAIDGAFADWQGIAGIPDSAGEGSGTDFRLLRITDDTASLFLYVETAAAADPAKTILLFNSDRLGYTGDTSRTGSGFHGADYRWQNGALSKYGVDGWAAIAAASGFKASGTGLEIRIAKRDIGGDHGAGLNLELISADGKETLPDHGAIGVAYTWTRPIDKTAGIRLAPVPMAGQAIALETSGGRALVLFKNPRRNADLRVTDIGGHTLARFHGLTGTQAELPSRALPRSLLILSLHAEGLPPASKTYIVP